MEEEFTFYVWNITDYSNHFHKADERKLKSPEFGLSKNKHLKFCLHFYARCPVDGYDSFVALGLGISRFDVQQAVKVEFSVWVEDQVSGEVLKKDVPYTFDSNQTHKARVFRSFASRKKLDPLGQFVKNDTLTVYCRIRREIDSSNVNVNKSKLKVAYESRLFTDVQLNVNGQVFYAHKFVLAAHSDVFYAMFNNKLTIESQTNNVEVENVDSGIFQQMIDYFYTGEIEELDEIVDKLYQAADRYQVKDLMELCIDYLCTNLDVNTATNCLALAFHYQIQQLKQSAITFVIENYKEVMQSEEWKRLRIENAELSALIFDAILDESEIDCYSINT